MSFARRWNLLLDWLEEDKEWDRSKQLLDSVPPQMIADLAFRRRRLQLLEKARVGAPLLDPEWSQLLADFPEDISLYLYRFESLRKTPNRWDGELHLKHPSHTQTPSGRGRGHM